MKMCTTTISATAEGNLEVTSTYPKYGAWGGGEQGGGAGGGHWCIPRCCAPQG